ncbi:MAG: molybdopterin cofactor-binding domain-containing protein [Pseudomonadota bacterium]
MSSIEFRKDLFADERDDNLNEIGKPTVRQDILGHVTGRSPYYDDHLFDGLLHLKCVRSPHHHARIRSIDTSAAERMAGVKRVIKPGDVPNNLNTLLSLINFGKDDEALLQGGKVSYVGEPIVAIVAETEHQARRAVDAVKVDYDVLPHVLDPEEAMKPEAPTVNEAYPNNTFDYHELYDHQKLRFGDTQSAFQAADHVVEGKYQLSPIEQAPTETCGAIAAPETNDRYVCYTGTQALFFSLGTTAKLLDMPSSRLHFVGGTVGGGFGGKVDSLHEPLAVLGAHLTGAPVKYVFDRQEEMQVGAPRGAERWYIKDGVMNDGRIVARQFTGVFDAGAYSRLSPYAIVKATGHLPGPYTIPNVSSNVYCVYTNRTPATAMRGFGITAVDFAIECHMDKVASQINMNPIELRIKNAYRDGDMKAHRRLAKNTALIECCQVAAQKAGVRLSPELMADSSLRGGGTPERIEIPETLTDDYGKIGDRRRSNIPIHPGEGTGQQSRIAAGVRGEQVVAAPAQDTDMVIEPGRDGYRGPSSGEKLPQAPHTMAPIQPTPYPEVETAAQPATAAPAPPPPPTTPPPAASPPAAPPQQSAQPTPYQPDKPFDRGVKRPGVSRFLSGSRRR